MLKQSIAFSSFDRLVWITLGTLLALLLVLIWRGDQIALTPAHLHPAPDHSGISTRTFIEIEFDQPLATLPPATQLQVDPPLAGNLQQWQTSLRFQPETGLQPYTTYTVTLASPVAGAQGGKLREPLTWHFTTGGLQVAYTAVSESGTEQLYVVDAGLDQAQRATESDELLPTPNQVTDGPLNIWDFSVSPTDSSLLYSALKQDGTSDLWQVRPGQEPTLFLPCPNAVCSDTAWSPDGRLLAYARRNAGDFGAAAFNPPRLWLYDIGTQESISLFADNQKLAFGPHWSADGEWLSYLAPDVGEIGIIHLTTNAEQVYASPGGDAAIWHPQEVRFVYSLLKELDVGYVAHLHLVDPQLETESNLSGEAAIVEDNAPAWSPDGAWLALRRKELTGPGATPGKQIWRMRADGTAAEPLTADPAYDHSPPQWSPDGRYLLYHKLPLKGPEIVLSVWVYDVVTGTSRELARPGQRPQWLP